DFLRLLRVAVLETGEPLERLVTRAAGRLLPRLLRVEVLEHQPVLRRCAAEAAECFTQLLEAVARRAPVRRSLAPRLVRGRDLLLECKQRVRDRRLGLTVRRRQFLEERIA